MIPLTWHLDADKNLVITTTRVGQKELKEDKNNPDFESDRYMIDTLESLLCNSEYDWIAPYEIGALTNAPILGIRGRERKAHKGENTEHKRITAVLNGTVFVDDVLEVWWYPDYAIRSPQDDLLEYGETVFTNAS